MLNIFKIQKREFKRLFGAGFLIPVLLIIIAVCWAITGGAGDYKNLLNKGKEYLAVESATYDNIQNYAILSVRGVGVYFLPSQLSIISADSSLLSDLSARIDTVIALNITASLKGSALFESNYSLPPDFDGIIRIFMTLFAIFFIGFGSLREKEYLKTIASASSMVTIHLSIIITRIVLLAITIIAVYGGMLSVLVFNKIRLTQSNMEMLSSHALSALIMLIFFFFLGAIMGLFFPSNWKGFFMTLMVWALCVFGFQGLFNTMTRGKAAGITSNYQTQLEQFEIVTLFEKRAIKEQGKFDKRNIESGRKIIEGYWKDDYKRIEALEEKLKSEISGVISEYESLCLYTPVSFYNLTCNEVSSRGYENFIVFYSYLQELKRKFLRFWFDRVYYNDPSVMAPFITKNENLFKARSRLPRDYWTGLLRNLAYIVILFFVTLFLSLHRVFEMKKEEIAGLGTVNIEMKKGELNVWLTEGKIFRNLLLNLLFGQFNRLRKKGFTGTVILNKVDIASEKNREKFLYIAGRESMPNSAKVKNFISDYADMYKLPLETKTEILNDKEILLLTDKRIGKLTEREKFEVLLTLTRLKKKQVYLIDAISSGLPVEYAIKLKERMDRLTTGGSTVIYLATTEMTDIDLVKMGVCFEEGSNWIRLVKGNKKIKEVMKKNKKGK